MGKHWKTRSHIAEGYSGKWQELCVLPLVVQGAEKQRRLNQDDIEWAATEIRNEYRRILDKNDLAYLKKIHEHNRLEYNDRLRPIASVTCHP